MQETIPNQTAFDIVAVGLLKQGGPSVDIVKRQKVCRYRSKNNRKCAIGLLVDDKEYNPGFEDYGVSLVFYNRISQYLYNKKYDLAFLAKLQHAHDTCREYEGIEFVREFVKNMKITAIVYRLNSKKLNSHIYLRVRRKGQR
jgi:hypothetical protein